MTARQQISPERKELMQRLSDLLKLPCKNLALLDKATTHRSYGSEHDVEDFERLEFFGDAVLKFVVAEYLFTEFPAEDEGELTEICAVLISAKTLETVGKSFGLENYIRVGRGVGMRPSIVARSMEALLGAFYLDSKFKSIRPFIIEHICSKASAIAGDEVKENYKAQLQQYTQARAQGTPVYTVVSTSGPPHDPMFRIAVSVGERVVGEGTGRSKKIAEQDAARTAMAKISPARTEK